MAKRVTADVLDGAEAVSDVAVAEHTTATEKAVIPETPPVTVKTTDTTVVYIGPSIGRTELVNGRVFMKGTALDDKFGDIFIKVPSARKLFIPAAQLGAAQEKLRKGGNALNAAYQAAIKEMEVNK